MKFTFKEHENVCVFNRNYDLKKTIEISFVLNRLLVVVFFFSVRRVDAWQDSREKNS